MQRKIRVLVGKPGLDGHDRGAKVVAAALRDAGMEVIYTGLHQTPGQVVEAAVQEDVDVVALSILSGAHMTLFPEVLELMRERGIGDRLLTGGGIIPPEDMESLAKMGVGRLFGPGASTQDIAKYIRGWFEEEHGAAAAPAPRATAAATPRATAAATTRATAAPAPRATAAAAPAPRATAAPAPRATAAATPRATAVSAPRATAAPAPRASASASTAKSRPAAPAKRPGTTRRATPKRRRAERAGSGGSRKRR
jgi:methylmalonyl-CoA mutase C-terminal domain/subunit